MKNKIYTLVVALILYSIGLEAQENKKADTIRINQYGQEVDFQSLTGESQDGILKFTSDDKSYSIWFDNRVQFDGAFFYEEVKCSADIVMGV